MSPGIPPSLDRQDQRVALVVGTIILVAMFVATLVVGAMINYLIGELIRVTGLSGTDRFLGMAFGAARGALLVVTAVGLLSLGPVQQDSWWQESRLVPQFLLVADWSKNLILGWSSQWLASGISVPADIPFKEHLLPTAKTPQ